MTPNPAPSAVHILGRFPPPVDGQTMQTERVARLLEETTHVRRTSTTFEDETHVQADVQWRFGKVRHYLSLVGRLRRSLAARPEAPVLWPAISPMPLGHLRDLLTVLPAFQPGQKVYAVIHWGNFDRLFRSPFTRFTAPLLVRRLSGFVFLDGLAEKCAPWIPAAKRFTISNTIDEATRCTDAEVAAKQARRAVRQRLRLLFLSNMIPSKGYLDVLQAVNILHTEGLAVQADFVGRWQTDEEQAAFTEYVARHGLASVVTAHGGVQDRGRIKQFYLDADVFLLPTYYPTEAQPVSIVEALNAGTPVVTTRHASIPIMVREEHREALFVLPRAPEAIAAALRQLADTDHWTGFSQAARRRFLEHFSPEAVRRKWVALLSA